MYTRETDRPGVAALVSLAGIALILMCLSSAVLGQSYGASVAARQISPTVWSFTISNTSTPSDCWLSDVGFYVDTWRSAIIADRCESGCEAFWSGKDDMYWMDSGPWGESSPGLIMTMYSAIAPGQSEDGFQIEFEQPMHIADIVGTRWEAWPWSPHGAQCCTGTVTLQQSPVPEPSSLITLVFALLSVAGAARLRAMRSV